MYKYSRAVEGLKRQKGAAYAHLVWFGISGNFDPDVVTEKLELKPFQIYKMNKHYAFSVATNESDWDFGKHAAYDKDNMDGFLMERLLTETIKPLLDKIDILNQIRNKNDVRFTLYVHTDIFSSDMSLPHFSLPLEVMDFCAGTGTKISLGVNVDGKILKLPSFLSP